MNVENDVVSSSSKYPWRGFLVFLGMYLLGLATYYPVLLAQAEVYLEIVGESFAYTPNQFAGLALIQPLLLGIVAIYGGHRYAQKVNLRSLISEKIEKRAPVLTGQPQYTLADSVPFIVLFAIGLAFLTIGFDFVFQNGVPETLAPTFTAFNLWQVLSQLFYGGLGQEILLRWGVMTALVYVISAKGKQVTPLHYIMGFTFTAFLYGFSQYSSMAGMIDLTPILWLRLFLLNVLDGMLYGWLYAKFHFEAAALSHLLTNLFIILGTFVIAGISG